MGRLNAQTHRRHVKSPYSLDGIPMWDDLRYITVYRHPIDVYFSFRKHAANQIKESAKPFSKRIFFQDPSKDSAFS
ncbi:hypothetical protein K3727_08575 [Rhodobacteraceae bacterium M382]|nr:hypothetical protein K3727_08575 [Rhodobacteraceae bacterium M382]